MIRSGVICAGNWIVDLVHDIDSWPEESNLVRIGAQTRGIGGGAANVIASLAKLDTGFDLWPMGALGEDEFGRFILSECKALGLPTDRLHVKSGVATAHTHVMTVSGRSRTFFYQGGANDALAAEDFPEGTFAKTPARLFYLGYLTLLGTLDTLGAAGRTEASRVLERAQQAGLTTCVDLVSIQHPAFAEILRSAAPYIDYLVLNEIEAARATGTDPGAADADTLLAMAGSLLAYGVCRAVVIHCAERCVWADANGGSHIMEVVQLPEDQIASHLGAGDAFCAGLLFAIHEAWPAERALACATSVARASLRGMTATSSIPPLSELRLDGLG
ncbi:MAG: carbohydrate kinase family protein [Pseudomonadota bacterium]